MRYNGGYRGGWVDECVTERSQSDFEKRYEGGGGKKCYVITERQH